LTILGSLHSPASGTLNVFPELIGVEKRIGDLQSLRIGKGSIGSDHLPEQAVFRQLAGQRIFGV
jgi:hypothetical protein